MIYILKSAIILALLYSCYIVFLSHGGAGGGLLGIVRSSCVDILKLSFGLAYAELQVQLVAEGSPLR